MTWQENLFSNLLSLLIILSLILIVYLKVTKKTLVDFIKDLQELSGGTEVYE